MGQRDGIVVCLDRASRIYVDRESFPESLRRWAAKGLNETTAVLLSLLD